MKNIYAEFVHYITEIDPDVAKTARGRNLLLEALRLLEEEETKLSNEEIFFAVSNLAK